MRLWNPLLIPRLPNKQLVSQWRELNNIYKKQPKHILINFIYNYDKEHLYAYSMLVINEMKERNLKIKSYEKFNNYFQMINRDTANLSLRYAEHDLKDLLSCYFNLEEKYRRGQKDFDYRTWYELYLIVGYELAKRGIKDVSEIL